MEWSREWTKVTELEYEEIIYEKKYFDNGGVARITFCHQVKPGMNAATETGMMEMRDALNDANHDDSIGVVVLTGLGDKSFILQLPFMGRKVIDNM